MHRTTGAQDVVLGLPLTNRSGRTALRTPAMMVNVMPLRIAVRPRDTGAELLRRVVLEVRAVRRHQRHRQEDLRRDLGLTAPEQPLFGPMINIKPFEGDLGFGESRGVVHNLAAGAVDDLAVGITPGADGSVRLSLDANPARYDAPSLAWHEHGLRRYLEALAALLLDDPQRPVGTIDLLDADEIRRATAGRTEPAAARTLPELLAEQAVRTPDAVAVRGGSAALTFAELDSAANRLAHELRAVGVRAGTPVALALPRGTDTVVALFAVLKAGGVCQSLDLGHPAQRIAAVLDDTRPGCVVGTADAVRSLPEHDLPVLLLDDPATRARVAARPGTAPAAPAPTRRRTSSTPPAPPAAPRASSSPTPPSPTSTPDTAPTTSPPPWPAPAGTGCGSPTAPPSPSTPPGTPSSGWSTATSSTSWTTPPTATRPR